MSEKVAIVTGASAGIGEATARRLHGLGYRTYAVARRVDRMAALGEAGIDVVAADVTVDADLVALVDRVMAKAGRIDVVVNNAGYGSYGALEEVPMEEARRQVEVNLLGLARLTQLALPAMRAQRSGTIVNVSSIGGRFGEPFGAWYHATKFAVEGLSDSIRPELRPFGIDVVVIQPGAIATEWAAIAADNLEATAKGGPYEAHARTQVELMRRGSGDGATGSSPEVIAKAIAKAVTARRPKTRYIVGMGAKPLLAMRWLLPDRAFDRALASTTRLAERFT